VFSYRFFSRFSAASAKPVRLIVAFAPGAQPDIIARLLADRLSRSLGQQVIVDNRPGTANLIGAQAAARAAPDGYTFFFATSAALITNPLTFKSLPYDPVRDFVPVSLILKSPFFILAHPDLPARTLPELFALARSKPGTLNFATDGPPVEAVQRFARETGGILRDPEVVQRLRDLGTYTVESIQTPEGFADYMRTERVYWAKLLKEIGVEPE
jgi:tripartite-type tricarboxylate transporter receptor subunit TctC